MAACFVKDHSAKTIAQDYWHPSGGAWFGAQINERLTGGLFAGLGSVYVVGKFPTEESAIIVRTRGLLTTVRGDSGHGCADVVSYILSMQTFAVEDLNRLLALHAAATSLGDHVACGACGLLGS